MNKMAHRFKRYADYTPLDKVLNRIRQYRWRAKLKAEILARYGDTCECCGEDNPDFLVLDHIHNNGSQERALIGDKGGYTFYLWLRKNGFPPGYQTLCFLCNARKPRSLDCSHPLKEVWAECKLSNIEERKMKNSIRARDN